MLEEIINKTKKVVATGLLSLALASCANNQQNNVEKENTKKVVQVKKRKIPKPKKVYDKFVLEHSGNPKEGTIYYIRAYHKVNDNFNNLASVRTKENDIRNINKLVSDYQHSILKVLVQLNAKDIFSEGTGNNYNIESDSMRIYKNKDLRKFLKDSNQIPNLKRELLENAISVYGNYFSNIKSPRRKTITHIYSANPNIETYFEILTELKKNGGRLNKRIEYLTTDKREDETLDTIKKFYSKPKNKSKEVVLIYGGAHEFKDNILRNKSKFNPRFYSIRFSEGKKIEEYINKMSN